MELSLIFQTIGTVIMVAGVVFSLINLRNYHASRRRESAIVLLNSFQTGDFVKGLLIMFALPEKFGKKEMDSLPEADFLALYMLLGTWERLGILVFHHEMDLDLLDDAFSGPVIQSWQKMKKFVFEFRASVQRDTAFEWFQWLAERLLERESGKEPTPAYIAHSNWKPKKK